MATESERRVFTHLLRMISVLMIIELDHKRGHTNIALAGSLTAAR